MRLTKEHFLVDIGDQSWEVPNSHGARQSKLNPRGRLTGRLFPDVKTVADVPLHGLEVSDNGPCFGWRDEEPVYKWLSYEEVIVRYRNISYGLVQIGMTPGQGTFVGIYGKNCIEWALVDHACHAQSVVPVPLYDSLGPSACTFVLNQTEAETVVCDTLERAKVLVGVRDEIPKLRRIVLMLAEPGEDLKSLALERGVSLHTLKEVEVYENISDVVTTKTSSVTCERTLSSRDPEGLPGKKELGRSNPGTLLLPQPEDLATICYTSGTTGNPKGVMLSHANMVADFSGFIQAIGSDFITPTDRYVCYLPLAHMLERESQVVIMSVGASIGFTRGDAKLIVEDIQALKPTIMAAVPRILNRIYDKVQAQISTNPIKKFLLETALKAKKSELDKAIIRNDSLWDRLILKNVRNILGGEVRLLVSAGAPIRDQVLSFFRCCMGCPVTQGYGQTESTAAATFTVFGDNDVGVVGPPMPNCMIKLADVPDMEYYSKNNEGEILLKGPIVSQGYFKDPEKTAETFDEDGWLHTGDIGRWTEKGALAIFDRKKNLLKLSQGEYVSPEKIESVYLGSPCIDMIFVDGNSLESCLVAIVVPDRAGLEARCAAEGIVAKSDWPAICDNKKTNQLLLSDLNQLGKEAGLTGYEQVKAIYIHPETFTQESGILTPTLKLKRPECRRRFNSVITDLYDSLKS